MPDPSITITIRWNPQDNSWYHASTATHGLTDDAQTLLDQPAEHLVDDINQLPLEITTAGGPEGSGTR